MTSFNKILVKHLKYSMQNTPQLELKLELNPEFNVEA